MAARKLCLAPSRPPVPYRRGRTGSGTGAGLAGVPTLARLRRGGSRGLKLRSNGIDVERRPDEMGKLRLAIGLGQERHIAALMILGRADRGIARREQNLEARAA